MERKKKIVLLAHCFLNINAKVMGIATEPAGCEKLVGALLADGYGIIQLPCPEQACLGISRWGVVKDQLDFPAFREQTKKLLQPIVNQVLDFINNDYKVAAVIGLDGSPSCGVEYTCSGQWGGEIGEGYNLGEKISTLKKQKGYGVMMEVLAELFSSNRVTIPFFSVPEASPDNEVNELITKINHA